MAEIDLQPWDRQEKEPNLWFNRFERFRLQGPTRSVNSVYVTEWKQKGKKPSSSAPTYWYENAEKWGWHERAEAWDMYEVARRRQEYEEERIEVREARRGMLRTAFNKLATALKAIPDNDERLLKTNVHSLVNSIRIIAAELRQEYDDQPRAGNG